MAILLNDECVDATKLHSMMNMSSKSACMFSVKS